MRCEDYPCCGHGPAPYGDDGGCPDAKGSFTCLLCGKRLAKDAPSAICAVREAAAAEDVRGRLMGWVVLC